ncbi:MAG: c-type cytochrome [Gammaproteobacteria bacterium]
MDATMRNLAWIGVLTVTLAACGGPDESAAPGDAGAPPPAAAEPEPAPDMDALLASADLKRGETLYFQCRACHTMNEGGPHKVGPNLWGMFGRKAGQGDGFAYSDAVKNSDIVWTAETVSAWLEQPADYLPGNMMVFVGVKKPQDRANLIAFLKANTGAAD